jgi:predicted permease
MTTLWQDIRYGVRMLAKNRGVTTVAVVTLALGIAANTVLFSAVNDVLLRPLPVEKPEGLLCLGASGKQDVLTGFPFPVYEGLSRQEGIFSELAAQKTRIQMVEWDMGGGRTSIPASLVSGTYFPLLGAQTCLGRPISVQDDTPGKANVAVISHSFWQRAFGRDSEVLGRVIRLNTGLFTIVGVAAPGFRGIPPCIPTDVWLPLSGCEDLYPGSGLQTLRSPFTYDLTVLGRLKAGVSVERAQARLTALLPSLDRPDGPCAGRQMVLTFCGRGMAPLQLRGTMWTLAALFHGMAMLVLTVACINVMHLVLARGLTRQKDTAVRLALGAGRWRIVRQSLTESLLLAFAGGILAIWLARVANGGLLALLPQMELSLPLRLHVDWRVMVFAFGVASLTALLFGLAPAVRFSSPDVQKVLQNEAGTSRTTGRRMEVSDLIIVGEVAISFFLVVGGGLALRSLWKAQAADLGFQTKDRLLVPIQLASAAGGDPVIASESDAASRRQIYQAIQECVLALPGTVSAAYVQSPPLDGTIRYDPVMPPAGEISGVAVKAGCNGVGSGYFATMGISILQGSEFPSQGEPSRLAQSVIVNETMARHYWPQGDPVGRLLELPDGMLEVRAVVHDSRYFDLHELPQDHFYRFALTQPADAMTLVVHYRGSRATLAEAILDVLPRVDSRVHLREMCSFAELLRTQLMPQVVGLWLLGGAGVTGLLIAAVGLYGVLSHLSQQRTREVGIRMALGALRRDMLWLLVAAGLRWVSVGVLLGLGLAWAFTRFLSRMLYGVGSMDVATLLVASILVIAVGILACVLPACKATRADPMAALRYE